MTMIVANKQNRNKSNTVPIKSVLGLRRNVSWIRGLGPRSRRTNAANRKIKPATVRDVNNPERHQSRRSPWSSAAKSKAKDKLAESSPLRLGAGEDFFGGDTAGI